MDYPSAHPDPSEITRLLSQLTGGASPEVMDALTPAVYDQLRGLAGAVMRDAPNQVTLQPTALVNEAYLRLVGSERLGLESRSHFLAIAAKAMRYVLADYARKRNAEKRGGGWCRVTLSGVTDDSRVGEHDAAEIDAALTELMSLDERHATIVELRFFGGMTIGQIADHLGVSKRTVDADWKFARAWLRRRLQERDG